MIDALTSSWAAADPCGVTAAGNVPGAAHRHPDRRLRLARHRPGPGGPDPAGVGNPVAAMPSLHAGIAFLVALYGIQRLHTRWRWLLALYPLAMSTALVYNAEHYVIDILAGALLAVLVLVGCQAWESSRDRAVTPWTNPPTG
jgi:membrane-associated phospholipid phosphatase